MTYLNVDSDGRIKLDELTDSIRDDTVLISVIAVNSETGVIQDLEKIGNIIKQKNKNVYFHSDFVQGLGHIKINPAKCRLDALTVSSHKVYGPKGAGAIYLSGNVKIKPLIFGSSYSFCSSSMLVLFTLSMVLLYHETVPMCRRCEMHLCLLH